MGVEDQQLEATRRALDPISKGWDEALLRLKDIIESQGNGFHAERRRTALLLRLSAVSA
jgi:hypothetical protein